MDDLGKYYSKRKERDPEFAPGLTLVTASSPWADAPRSTREGGSDAGGACRAIATKKSVISRLENRASDARVSTLRNGSRRSRQRTCDRDSRQAPDPSRE
jgi:hypothetical protein